MCALDCPSDEKRITFLIDPKCKHCNHANVSPPPSLPPHLRQLPDDPITLGADELLDRVVAEDDVRVLADLDAATRVDEDLKPSIAGQFFGHNYAL
eukprot:1160220-Pelagomonas_calceolata.AAC.7